MSFRKEFSAQGTIEYLVIIAIVIVISLIVIGLVITTTSNPSQQIKDSSSKLASASSGGISIVESVVDSSGDAVVSLRNNSGESFTLSSISGLSGGSVVGNNEYGGYFVSSGGLSTFSLANLGSACVCASGEKSKTCTFEITLTSASGLVKTERVSTTVECVTDAQGVSVINPLTFQPIWLKNPVSGTGTGADSASSVFVDSSGNIYIAGQFNGNINFSPTIGLTHQGSGDFFVVKYDSSGNALWAKNPTTGTGADQAFFVFVDSSSNVYVTGRSKSDINFSSTVGLIHRGSTTLYDFFVVKYDSSGNALWAKNPSTGTGTDIDSASSVFVDSFSNVYVAGYFSNDINFSSTVGLVHQGNVGWYDFFIVKYDFSGTALWAKNPVATTGISDDVAYSVFVDSSDNVYLAGYAYSDINFSPTVGLVNPGNNNFFVVKYNSSGVALWAKNPVSGTGTGADHAYSVFVDSSGNVYVAGQFVGSDLNFSSTVGLTNSGNWNFFVVKYDFSGTALWAKTSVTGTGTVLNTASSVFVDSLGNVYVAGDSKSDINFSSTVGLTHQGTTSYYDFFVVKYDSSGNALWVKGPTVGTGTLSDKALASFVDSSSNVFVAGYFSNDINFSSNMGLTNSSGVSDFFITKYGMR